jgi:hypothetical protein
MRALSRRMVPLVSSSPLVRRAARAASAAAARPMSTLEGEPLNTCIILGSTRAKRIGGTVSDYLVRRLEARGGHNITVVDPRTTEGASWLLYAGQSVC